MAVGLTHPFFFNKFFMKGIIEKIDGAHATIRLVSGEALIWPTAALPESAKVMSVVDCNLTISPREATDQNEISRRQLNEILASQPEE
ncbi:hypothetical protein C4546_00905 [Candidatus Parcubacteria bacterium]|nr:MAG: hypothetical protein C4546_00905 [Candidatus Parcubacteria bacterium]